MIKISRKNPILIAAVVFGLLIFLHLLGVLKPLERGLSVITKPIGARLHSWGTGLGISYDEKREKEGLLSEIARLESEAAKLAIDSARCLMIEEENNKLRNQLDFAASNDFQTIMANIIAKEGSLPAEENSRDIIIDKGSRDGLKFDMGVLSEEGIIIGKVVELKDNSARVCLTTSPGCQLAASLQNSDKTQGLTDGRLGLTIVMDYIPQLEKINVGDTVITSGLSSTIPRGLVVGRVTDVKSESNEVWQSATIEPLINLNNLTVVSVIIP